MINLYKTILSLLLLFGLSACSSDPSGTSTLLGDKIGKEISNEIVSSYAEYLENPLTYSSDEFSITGEIVMTLNDDTQDVSKSVYMTQENGTKVPVPYSNYEINSDASYTFEAIGFILNGNGDIESVLDNIRFFEFKMATLTTGTYTLSDGVVYPFNIAGEDADIFITSVTKAGDIIHIEGNIPVINYQNSKTMSVDSFSIDFRPALSD